MGIDWDDFITWECPNCEEEHADPRYLATHCRKCGLMGYAQDGYLDTFGPWEFVEIEKSVKGGDRDG